METEALIISVFIGKIRTNMYCVEIRSKSGLANCDSYTFHEAHGIKANATVCTICGKEKTQFARLSFEVIHNPEGEWTAYDIHQLTIDSCLEPMFGHSDSLAKTSALQEAKKDSTENDPLSSFQSLASYTKRKSGISKDS